MAQPTIVLLHGQPDSSASFWALRRELRSLVDPCVRIAIPDRPGYGVNPLPATGFSGNVAWLADWLERIDAGPALLVGHSWAGGVAILAAASSHGNVGGIALLASVGPSCLLRMDPLLAAPAFGEVIAFGTLGLGRGAIIRKASTVLGKFLAKEDTPYAWTSGAAMRRRALWRSFLVEQRALLDELADITDALERINMPTSVISGSTDPVIPSATGHALATRIAGARRVVIQGGHDLQVRQPVEVAAEIAVLAQSVFGDVAPKTE